MTSHEMRNPLSTIFQCADAIISALSPLQEKYAEIQVTASNLDLQERLVSAMEAAATIALCAQHQKRIVDDVLVLSKVDANLIEISPVMVQPKLLVESALRMFSAELASHGIRMDLRVERSFSDLWIDRVLLDPGRLMQVLINLCTNAIKFTNASRCAR